MKYAPNTEAVRIITRREVRDTLSDWRIVLPMILLTFILPLLLVNATDYMITFVDDEQLAARLVPFITLLVGFIPASFSIVTALESFVGERERNSLEALLSTPVDDRDLYTSKLTAALATPLLSSYMAMLVATFLLYAFFQTIYFEAITTVRLMFLFISVGLMAVTMVAAAVVISSHISSIRAANLMSSFVLLPMALVVQMQAFLIINNRWDVLWFVLAGLAIVAMLLIRVGVFTFNREEILSREHQRFWRLRLPMFQWLQRSGTTNAASRPRGRFVASGEPIVNIVGREIYEAITDWRLLIPVAILTFGIPLVLVSLADFAVEFVGDANQIGRLIPFFMLMLGFIPASFSLIMALESFVGERERNTLESLLAMPIADKHLYISKLISTLVIPIFTSYGAMLTFGILIALTHPDLYFYGMNIKRLVLLLTMVGAISAVMVSGAVIISSHTGSIRAATLLASFVLIPMSASILIQSVFIISGRWDLMLFVLAAFVVVAMILVRTGMGAFSREEILSRSNEDINLRHLLGTFTTFFREYQPAGVEPHHYQGLPFSARRFYRQELPALLREMRYPLLAACVAVVAGLWGGLYMAENFRIAVLENRLTTLGNTYSPGLGLALFILANNLRVSILSNVFSLVSFGLTAFLVPFIAFLQIGFVTGKLMAAGGGWMALESDSPLTFLLAYVVPHGMVELPIFVLSAAMGMRIGASLLTPPPGFSIPQNMLWSLANFAKLWLLVLLPGVLVGSLIEGLVSPLVIQALY
jgi:uncharacterized membrane protein SpoIIM required for sporulation/ABC-type Na+ efflux pump permease subunit